MNTTNNITFVVSGGYVFTPAHFLFAWLVCQLDYTKKFAEWIFMVPLTFGGNTGNWTGPGQDFFFFTYLFIHFF